MTSTLASTGKTKVAIIGSGNIGTDLMIKVLRGAKHLEMGAMVGLDPDSDGLARAKRMGVQTTHEGVDGLMALPDCDDIDIIFDGTSAKGARGERREARSAGEAAHRPHSGPPSAPTSSPR